MKCQKCGSDSREGVKFCEECGAELELECPAGRRTCRPGAGKTIYSFSLLPKIHGPGAAFAGRSASGF